MGLRYREPPSYPNWQRKRIQNPCSVSSNLTEGTRNCGRLIVAVENSFQFDADIAGDPAALLRGGADAGAAVPLL